MTGTNSFRARLFPGGEQQLDENVVRTVDEKLESDERIEFRIPSTDSVTLDGNDGEKTIPVAADGQSLAVVTDRKLLFAIETPNSEAIEAVPYTDLKDIELSTGLFGTTLSVEVWAVGTYEFSPSKTESLEQAVEFVDRVSACWQQVVAALQKVEDQTEEIRDHLEAGQTDAAKTTRETAKRHLERAESKATADDTGASEAMEQRIGETAREFDRARLEGRLARVETLRQEARHQTDSQAYTGAYNSYQRAREHLETALVIDIDRDFGRAGEIQEEIDRLETRVRSLYVRPAALAHQALERAEGTEQIDVRVQALRDAFEHYRDALTAGWGMDTGFSEIPDLRERIESVATDLIEARRAFADKLTEDGDRYRAAGDESMARQRYDMAANQLDAAETLAREFRAGDCDAIRKQHRAIATRRVVAVV